MNNRLDVEFFLTLVNKTIHNEFSMDKEYQDINWELIYEYSNRNKLTSILYDTVQLLSDQYNINEELMLKWRNVTKFRMLAEVNKYIILRKILFLAKERNLTLILFKGCVLADLYPNYLSRSSDDTDIFVYQRDKDNVIQLLESIGFQKSSFSKEAVYNYILEAANYMIELHFSLWEDYKGTKIDILDKMQLVKEESLIQVKVCGMEVTTLGYEEHLIFQVFHIIKHFSLQGSDLRCLVDLALYFNKYEQYINLSSFWEKIRLLSYTKFCENIFTLCIKYFGMSPKIIESRSVKLIDNMEDFLCDLINIGPGYEKRTAAWEVTSIIMPYFLGEQEIPKSKFQRKIRILFPSSKACRVVYIRKHTLLTPIAWVRRCYRYLFKIDRKRNLLSDYKERMMLSETRLSLMYNLDLANKEK